MLRLFDGLLPSPLSYRSRLSVVAPMYDIRVCLTYRVRLGILSCMYLTFLPCLSIVIFGTYSLLSSLLYVLTPRARTNVCIARVPPIEITFSHYFCV